MGGVAAIRRKVLAAAAGALLLPTLGGCMMRQPDARYIYQDGQFGVIGVPQNSPFGLKNYEKQARELMAKHFPDGFEVVRAEEVVEGQRVLDRNRSAQLETEPTIGALNQKIKLGRVAESISTQQKDSVAITESRIIYKKRSPETPFAADGFAAKASLVPELYLDPNELMRAHAQVEIAEAKKGKAAGTTTTAIAATSTTTAGTTTTTTAAATAPASTADPAPAPKTDSSVQRASVDVKK